MLLPQPIPLLLQRLARPLDRDMVLDLQSTLLDINVTLRIEEAQALELSFVRRELRLEASCLDGEHRRRRVGELRVARKRCVPSRRPVAACRHPRVEGHARASGQRLAVDQLHFEKMPPVVAVAGKDAW